MHRRAHQLRVERLSVAGCLVAALLTGCGGGSGGSGSGGGSGGGGSSDAPAPPVVSYSGNAGAALLDEANAALFTATLVDGLTLVESLAESIVRETDLRPGRVNETIQGREGGSATVSGNIANDLTGWIQVDYRNFREDGIALDGREVQVILARRTPTSGHVRLSYHGLRLQSAGESYEFIGSLTRQESGGTRVNSVTDVDLLVTDLGSGEVRRVGPWRYGMQFDFVSRSYTLPALAVPVYSHVHGVATVSMTEALEFGSGFASGDVGRDGMNPGPHRGALVFSGAGGTSFRLVGLNRYFGALEFTASDGRRSTRRLAWDDEYEGLSPGPGSVMAAAGPTYRGEILQRVDLEGRMAEHTGARALQHAWQFVARPPGSQAVLFDAQSPTPWFVPDRFGTYLVEQQVTDGVGTDRDSARVLVLDWGIAVAHGTQLPDVTPWGGPDRRVALGAPVSLDARGSGTGLALQSRFISWGLPGALGGAYVEGPLASALALRRGGHAAYVNVNVPGQNGKWAQVNVFVDTPFWVHRPLLVADDMGLLVRPTDMAVADFDGDGRRDLVVSRWVPQENDSLVGHAGAALSVFPFGTAGGLGAARHFTLPFAGALAVGDLDGDGLADIVLRGNDQVAVLYQRPEGGLQAGPVFHLGPCRFLPHDRGGLVHIGDVTGNGRPDIVAAGACEPAAPGGPDAAQGVVTLVQGEARSFNMVITPVGTGWLGTLTAGDITGDGRTDIVMSQGAIGGGGMQVGFARADGGFEFEQVPLGSSFGAPLVADLNGDGRAQIAVLADGSLEVFARRADGAFDRQSFAAGHVTIGDTAFAGDVDGDGRVDVLLVKEAVGGDGGRGIEVMMQDPAGRLAPPIPVPLLSSDAYPGTRLMVIDLDGDGRGEIVAARASFRSLFHSGTLEVSRLRL